MSQKLITFAVPCYNSADYMRHCVQTLLAAGETPRSSWWTTAPPRTTPPLSAMSLLPSTPPSSRPSTRRTAATARASTRVCATPPAVLQGGGQRRLAGYRQPAKAADPPAHPDPAGPCPGYADLHYVYEHVEDGTTHTVRYTNVFLLSVCSNGSTWGISARTSIC